MGTSLILRVRDRVRVRARARARAAEGALPLALALALTLTRFERKTELTGHHGFVRALAVSGGGALLFSGSQDKTVRVWDTHTHVQLCALSGHQEEVLVRVRVRVRIRGRDRVRMT